MNRRGIADWVLIAVGVLVLAGGLYFGQPEDKDGDGRYEPTRAEEYMYEGRDMVRTFPVPGAEVLAGILGLGAAGLASWRKAKTAQKAAESEGKYAEAKAALGVLVQSIDTAKESLSPAERDALHAKLREIMPDKVKDVVRSARRMDI